MRKPESLTERLWRSVSDTRYRGVLLVISIPVALILTVICLVPRTSPLHMEHAHTLKELRHGGGVRYAIVFDAGSTGSRIHVFKFDSAGGQLKLLSDTFEQLKPGLSSFADEPEKAAASLQPLLDTALKTVPKELQASTPISLKATAGLRLLPGDKADNILKAVEKLIKAQPFKLAPGGVAIMDGKDEGAFAWLTLNYLLGKLDGPVGGTVAAIDMGGGSIQEAFALEDKDAAAAPKDYVTQLHGGGKTFNVYVHSYLGHGLMAGRAKVIEKITDNSCFPKGASGKYAYGGKEYEYKEGTASQAACAKVGQDALALDAPCDKPKDECSFNGGWRGKDLSKGRAYHVSSYFWDRAVESGLINKEDAIMFPTTVKDFAEKAGEVCGKASVEELAAAYPKADAKFLCLDMTYGTVMLLSGFRLAPTQPITLVKQVEYNGQHIEAAWPLGAAVNDLSA